MSAWFTIFHAKEDAILSLGQFAPAGDLGKRGKFARKWFQVVAARHFVGATNSEEMQTVLAVEKSTIDYFANNADLTFARMSSKLLCWQSRWDVCSLLQQSKESATC
jgi:hypothetical protein